MTDKETKEKLTRDSFLTFTGFQKYMLDQLDFTPGAVAKPKRENPSVDDLIQALLIARSQGLRGDSSLILSLTDSQIADATITGFDIKISEGDSNYVEIQCKHPEVDEYSTIVVRERFPEVRSE
mgnify:CR=1 FL=1